MNNFIELTDKSIVNTSDIILVNVDRVGGKYVYKLYLRGKGMTLRLSDQDYTVVRKCLVGNSAAEDKQ